MNHSGPVLGSRDGLTVIDCQACGWAHLETMPDADALALFYSDKFWTEEKPHALERIEQQREWWLSIHSDWLCLTEKYVTEKTLLDVGSGYGHFLRGAFIRGWDIQGIELSLRAAKYASHLTGEMVWCGSWQMSPYELYDLKYGCVSALWLIEHLPDPFSFLRWAHSRLVPGGVLLAVVPNDFSPAQIAVNGKVGKPFYWIDHTHLNYFTSQSFLMLLERAGFRVVERSTLFPVEEFLAEGQDYTVDPALGARLYDWVTENDLTMTRVERLGMYQTMAADGRGRELVYVAVKE